MKRNSFTLVEMMAVIVIMATMAGLALPRIGLVIERHISAEGVSILTAIRGAQERWRLEFGGYTNNAADLDIVIPPSNNFNAPVLYNNGAQGTCTAGDEHIAGITRPGMYSFEMCVDPTAQAYIACTDIAGNNPCTRMGY